jgi:hypothetical protein
MQRLDAPPWARAVSQHGPESAPAWKDTRHVQQDHTFRQCLQDKAVDPRTNNEARVER